MHPGSHSDGITELVGTGLLGGDALENPIPFRPGRVEQREMVATRPVHLEPMSLSEDDGTLHRDNLVVVTVDEDGLDACGVEPWWRPLVEHGTAFRCPAITGANRLVEIDQWRQRNV